MDFKALRKEYEQDGIDESKLIANPIDLFRVWFAAATENCPGEWFEPNAMTLATSDNGGTVSARIVLLKAVTDTGIQFFTNYESEKGRQLAANPRAAAVFHWPYLGRQVRLQGPVEKTTREVSESYFHSRPRGSQIGAAASRQSATVDSRNSLDQVASELSKQHQGQEIPVPEFWGGYELTVHRFEFWQGRLDRLHDRIVFERNADEIGWQRSRLSP